MRRVRQEHAKGCGLACIAMITGESYDSIRAEMDGLENTGHDGDWDAHGIDHMAIDRLLIAHGFYAQRIFMAWHRRRLDNRDDPADPVRYEMLPDAVWPPEPWADLHHAEVQQPSGHGHSVVMDGGGCVYDPLREGFYSLSDWPQVNNVAGLIRGYDLEPLI